MKQHLLEYYRRHKHRYDCHPNDWHVDQQVHEDWQHSIVKQWAQATQVQVELVVSVSAWGVGFGSYFHGKRSTIKDRQYWFRQFKEYWGLKFWPHNIERPYLYFYN